MRSSPRWSGPLVAVLATAVATALPAPAAPPPVGAPAPDSNGVFRVEELGPGVWAAVVRRQPAAYAFANSLVVEGTDGLLVVDTQQSPAAARALLSLLRERTDLPVRWVVNTHWHGDHVNGNEAYRDAFPDVRIVAHRATRRDMLGEGRARREDEVAGLPASIEDRRGWLESGVGPGGETLGEEQLAAVRRSLELREAYLAELRELRETPPGLTFTDALTIHLGGRVVELVHPGPAHTAGDVVVYLPEEGVLAVGDLLEEGPLWLEGADVPGWAAALERVAALEATVVLPSHGGVHRDRGLLELQADFLGAAVEVARSALEGGVDEEGAAGSAGLERFRADFAGLGVEGEAFDRHVREAVREAFRDLAAAGASVSR